MNAGLSCLHMDVKPLTSVSFKGVGNATACVMGDKIYVSGGHYGYRGNCTYEKIQVYRPDVNEWSIITTTPHPGMRKRRREWNKNNTNTVFWFEILCFFRVWAVLCVSGQHAVFGGWTDDCCRLLQHREGGMEAGISDEGEEDGVWGWGDKWLYLCNWGILLLKRDLSAEHWEVQPSAGHLGDCGDSAQSGQITWMCLCFQCLVLNPYHKCCHFVPNGSIVELCTVIVSDILSHKMPMFCTG